MLIICENREGETPFSAPTYTLQNSIVSSIHDCVRYVRWRGSNHFGLVPGVYRQRYDEYYDSCRPEPFFIAEWLQPGDLVQAATDADNL